MKSETLTQDKVPASPRQIIASFALMVTAIAAGAKVTGVANWSWLTVLLPIWLPALIFAAVFYIVWSVQLSVKILKTLK